LEDENDLLAMARSLLPWISIRLLPTVFGLPPRAPNDDDDDEEEDDVRLAQAHWSYRHAQRLRYFVHVPQHQARLGAPSSQLP
jgi:hypothetical protein